MEVSRARRRPPRQQRISIRLWDVGWGLWGALRLLLGSLLAETLHRARLLTRGKEGPASPRPVGGDGTPSSPVAAQRPSKGSKASEVCGRSSWITWVSLWASPRRWVRFAWLLVGRWTSLVRLTLRWASSVVIAIKDADAKSTR